MDRRESESFGRRGIVVVLFVVGFGVMMLAGCAPTAAPVVVEDEVVLASEHPTDGGRMIPVETLSGTFEVWTRKIGDSPTRMILTWVNVFRHSEVHSRAEE